MDINRIVILSDKEYIKKFKIDSLECYNPKNKTRYVRYIEPKLKPFKWHKSK